MTDKTTPSAAALELADKALAGALPALKHPDGRPYSPAMIEAVRRSPHLAAARLRMAGAIDALVINQPPSPTPPGAT